MDSKLTRRGVMGLSVGASLSACTQPISTTGQNNGLAQSGTFSHGVASGDPFPNSVVLWTNISTDTSGDLELVWEISTDPDFKSTTQSGQQTTNASRDYCVKVIAENLTPGTEYFFRFKLGDMVSPIGRTRTLPVGATEHLHFAVASCANWQHGYFNTYDAIAKRAVSDPYDAMIHLGDYFYEYGDAGAGRLPDRVHKPKHEVLSLEDYRTRHAQYRSDSALQAATAMMPLIAVWDDHETSNDSWKAGAENHQANTEGDWTTRKQAALRAYYEWMPIREPRAGHVRSDIYRDFRFGDLVNLTCVETRLTARAEPIIVEDHFDMITAQDGAETFRKEVLYAPDREMFGQDQQNFIINSLKTSKNEGVTWRLLANQVIMGRPDPDSPLYRRNLEKLNDWPSSSFSLSVNIICLSTQIAGMDIHLHVRISIRHWTRQVLMTRLS